MPPKAADKPEDPKQEVKPEAKPEPPKAADKPAPEVKALAEKIFIQMCANNPRGFEPSHFAKRAYAMANAFVEHDPSEE